MGAIDMRTQKMLWQRFLGRPSEFGPLGIKTHLPIEMGMPTLGGPVTTASGLVPSSSTAG
jgi:quinate dehydrogenase (quinone)